VAGSDWEFLREVYAQWERGDFSDPEWMAPDFVMVAADGPSPGEWRGREAAAAAWGEILNAWDGFTTEAEEFRELGDGRVLVLTKNRGRGKVSGLELGKMATRGANLLTVRDGRAVKLVAYWDRDRAFADLGIESR
jgi:ketosteroid isomerase-like protein